MRVISKRSLVAGVAAHWGAQYSTVRGYSGSDDKAAIHQRLLALDPAKATVEEVNAIIGNESWTQNKCEECGKDVDSLVEIGQEPDYESHTAQVCGPCLNAAISLLNQNAFHGVHFQCERCGHSGPGPCSCPDPLAK